MSHRMNVLLVLFVLAMAGVAIGIGVANRVAEQPAGPQDVDAEPPTRGLDPRFTLVDLPHTGRVNCLAFSLDGEYLVAGSRETGTTRTGQWIGDLKVWNVASGKEIASIQFSQWIKSLSFSPDGKVLAVAASSANYEAPEGFLNFVQKPGELKFFEFPAMREIKKVEFEGLIEYVRFSPDGKRLGVLRNERIKRWELPNNLELFDFATPEKSVTIRWLTGPFAFSPDGKKVFVGQEAPGSGIQTKSKDGKRTTFNHHPIKAFDAFSGKFHELLGPEYLKANSPMEFLADGTLINGTIFFDMEKGAPVENFGVRKMGPGFGALSVSHDKRYLLGTSRKGEKIPGSKVVLEDIEKEELITVFEEANNRANFQVSAFARDHAAFAVGTDYYCGINGSDKDLQRGIPLTGHVLLFKFKAP